MSRASTLVLVQDIASCSLDAGEIGQFYDEIVQQLGMFEVLTGSSSAAVLPGNPAVIMPADVLRILDVHGTAGRLSPESLIGLNTIYGVDWRERAGSPLAYVKELENERAFRLVPNPDTAQSLTVLTTNRLDDLPKWLELPIAYEVLSRELGRESDHQDSAYAATAHALASFMFAMVGVETVGVERGQ